MKIKTFDTPEFISEIKNINLNQRMIKYSLFMKFIINNSENLQIVELTKSIYENSKRIPSGALSAIFTDPSFEFWLYISNCIEKRLINNEPIPKSDLPHLNFLNEKDNFLYFHLIDLNRWILAACLLSKIDFDSSILLRDRKLYIPILGVIFENLSDEIIINTKFEFSKNNLILKIGSKIFNNIEQIVNIANVGGKSQSVIKNIVFVPSLLLSGGKILLDNEDPIITSGWSTLYKNPDGTSYKLTKRENVLDSYTLFDKSVSLVHKLWPEIEFNISTIIRTIHIIESPYIDKHVSCTAVNFFGSILLSFENEFILAEAIIHEYSHNILNVVIASGQMFEGEIPDDEIYYSPWRDDPRHISGILHAVFVFNNVSKFFCKILEQNKNEFVYERQINIIVKLLIGIKVLKDYKFENKFAKIFVKELESDILNLSSKFSKSDIDLQFLSQLDHFKKWQINNDKIKINNNLFN